MLFPWFVENTVFQKAYTNYIPLKTDFSYMVENFEDTISIPSLNWYFLKIFLLLTKLY